VRKGRSPGRRSALTRGIPCAACGLLLAASCVSTVPAVRRPSYYSDLAYDAAAGRYRDEMEKRYRSRDISYPLSLLNYAVTSLYAQKTTEAKQAFTAAYKVDDGQIPEAAKFYQWLQVDGRKVYRFEKRERELVHLYLGLVYLYENNLPSALVEFKKLRQMDQDASRLPVVSFYTGLVYEKMGMCDDALIAYRGLAEMDAPGLDAQALIARVESLKTGARDITELSDNPDCVPGESCVDLIVHIDHQYASSMGRTVVYADGVPVATLGPVTDRFEVKLTEAEAARKVAQKATAQATRSGLRCCGSLLGELLWPGYGERAAELAADITLGDERDDREHRAWRYAPLAIAAARISIPAATREVRLEFFGPDGTLRGYCPYPLSGEHRRAAFLTEYHKTPLFIEGKERPGTYFILAGLAPEFYRYEEEL